MPSCDTMPTLEVLDETYRSVAEQVFRELSIARLPRLPDARWHLSYNCVEVDGGIVRYSFYRCTTNDGRRQYHLVARWNQEYLPPTPKRPGRPVTTHGKTIVLERRNGAPPRTVRVWVGDDRLPWPVDPQTFDRMSSARGV